MKRRLFQVILVCVGMLFVSAEATAEQAEEAPFSVSAEGAILIEVESGRVLYEKDAESEKRIASITKIMTAMIAVEQGNLDDVVTVSTNAEGTEGSSLYLRAGEKVTLRDLVYGLMLRSGNDSAVAIAEHIGGSVEGFVYLMNDQVRRLGLQHTTFANPHGLDDHEEHYSSAHDMAIIMQAAMQSDEFRDISGTEVHRAPNENESWDRVWKNKNRLLTERYEYSTGGKTGFTKRARRTLVSSAEKDGMELIAVTLNAPSDWDDHIRMFEYGFDTYQMKTLVKEGPISRQHQLSDESMDYEVHDQIDFPLTDEEIPRVVPRIKPIDQTSEDPHAADIRFMLDGEVITQAPLFRPLAEEPAASWWDRLKSRIQQMLR
ncbi:D-alanyl-D-alanine carboxypeptidase [Geomicrobium sp. JCM 19037]|uniref:D-alanyl-D-alanine carboxypeptidase family protein n=1 Tax=Geomicrobium sp. JCM 19037 TaxID=1460634 RepID=UPI00045F3A0E|nr:D-alanyl-D-alanine carboxypeptidase family protein [Geomicrobium sp. JCM 19037]GAK02362.1 D-alanyl-D-alanine carboxypeptidase [Geomicrobium sp. JCM 19037]